MNTNKTYGQLGTHFLLEHNSSLDVQASDSHLFPDSEDKFWIELKHYILIK